MAIIQSAEEKMHLVLVLGFFLLAANLCRAQQAPIREDVVPAATYLDSNVDPNADATGQAASGSGATASPDDQWHIALLPYLWFAGMHGTVGAAGVNAGVRASPGNLLSHLNVGLMSTVQASKNRWLLPVDLMWARLSDSQSLPENVAGVNSIGFRSGQFILTPQVGYQLVDQPKLKVAWLIGARYWHLGQKLTFNPSIFNSISTSQNWADVVEGGRIQMPLSTKASITIGGDAGGAGARLDYQVFGFLGFQLKKCTTLQAGWRYLDLDYRRYNNGFLYDVAQSGAVAGATFYFK